MGFVFCDSDVILPRSWDRVRLQAVVEGAAEAVVVSNFFFSSEGGYTTSTIARARRCEIPCNETKRHVPGLIGPRNLGLGGPLSTRLSIKDRHGDHYRIPTCNRYFQTSPVRRTEPCCRRSYCKRVMPAASHARFWKWGMPVAVASRLPYAPHQGRP